MFPTPYLQIQALDPLLHGLHPQSPQALCFASTRGWRGSGYFLTEGHSATARAASVNLQTGVISKHKDDHPHPSHQNMQ